MWSDSDPSISFASFFLDVSLSTRENPHRKLLRGRILMKRWLLRFFAFVFVFMLIGLGKVSSQDRLLDIRRLMTVAEFKAAGLDKLSPSELAALNQWVGKFAVQMLQPNRGSGDCRDVIESEIQGEFTGWTG